LGDVLNFGVSLTAHYRVIKKKEDIDQLLMFFADKGIDLFEIGFFGLDNYDFLYSAYLNSDFLLNIVDKKIKVNVHLPRVDWEKIGVKKIVGDSLRLEKTFPVNKFIIHCSDFCKYSKSISPLFGKILVENDSFDENCMPEKIEMVCDINHFYNRGKFDEEKYNDFLSVHGSNICEFHFSKENHLLFKNDFGWLKKIILDLIEKGYAQGREFTFEGTNKKEDLFVLFGDLEKEFILLEKVFFECWLDYYKKNIYSLLEESVKKEVPQSVLLSGGIDSSIIAYLSKKHCVNVKGITVLTKNTLSPDKIFSALVAKELNMNLKLAELDIGEVEEMIKHVVIALECFNIYWVSAALVLFKGVMCAKENGLDNVSTGEGSDDLFGSFPVMVNWKYTTPELNNFIKIRLKDIDVMTKKVGDYVGVKVITPFHSKALVDFALNIPLEYRTKVFSEGDKVTKYVLREAFKGFLPEKVVQRPQTMAFTGASTIDSLTEKYSGIDIFKYQKKYSINFKSSFECFLFDILNKAGKYKPIKSGNRCIYCRSKLRAKNSVHCTVCGTLQYKNKILDF